MYPVITLISGTLLLLSSAAAQDNLSNSPDADRLSQMSAEIAAGVQRTLRPNLMFDWNAIAAEDAAGGDYRAGTLAIARHDYEGSIVAMQRVVMAKSRRADSALYWEAYAQLKLGQARDALATLAELKRSYPRSGWLNDAKALDLEARNQSGHPVAPETAGDDDLKLLALNGLMNSDPSRATPLIEKVVADPKNAPQIRERALFVLARSTAPDARQTVTQMAQGAANPDLQVRAIQYLAATNPKENGDIFATVYRRSSEPEVKRAVLNALFLSKNASALLDIAKTESNPGLQREAVQFLGIAAGTPSLLSLYQSTSNDALKRSVIDSLSANGDAKALVNIAQHEANAQLKREAVECLSSMKDKAATDYMLDLLKK